MSIPVRKQPGQTPVIPGPLTIQTRHVSDSPLGRLHVLVQRLLGLGLLQPRPKDQLGRRLGLHQLPVVDEQRVHDLDVLAQVPAAALPAVGVTVRGGGRQGRVLGAVGQGRADCDACSALVQDGVAFGVEGDRTAFLGGVGGGGSVDDDAGGHEDVLPDVVVQVLAGDDLEELPGPVDARAVGPRGAWFEDERLAQPVFDLGVAAAAQDELGRCGGVVVG